MLRYLIISHLDVVENHVAIGARQISTQQNSISRLQRAGENTTDAIELLRELERTQERLVEYREELRTVLAQHIVAKPRGQIESAATKHSGSKADI